MLKLHFQLCERVACHRLKLLAILKQAASCIIYLQIIEFIYRKMLPTRQNLFISNESMNYDDLRTDGNCMHLK